ncbi:MAG: coenzyme F420-0:L-glutamate ligase [Candidatus Roizmanbacteria bacterium]
MKVTVFKTHKITSKDTNIFSVIDTYIPSLSEKSIVVVTSKIVSICEGRMVKKISDEQKDKLVTDEAEYYLPREFNQYGFLISINKNILVASAGIDESNGNGYYILWPEDPQRSANQIRSHLLDRFHLKEVGVIITDSKLTPLRWGVTGVSLSHSGFESIYSYVGRPDIFGRKLKAEKSNIADGLATSAVVVMGEGEEQQPLAVIDDVPFVQFQERSPTAEELDEIKISLDEDVYASMLTRVPWRKGKGGAGA